MRKGIPRWPVHLAIPRAKLAVILRIASSDSHMALVPYDVIRSQARYFWTWMAVKSHDAPQRNSLFVRGRT
jgi:hypothetical protein